MKIKLKIENEYDRLKEVIIGLPNTFNTLGKLKPINPTEEKYFNTPESPKKSLVIKEMHSFAKTLRMHGVKVHYPRPLKGTIDQLTPRDLGFVIDNTFIISHMAYKIREQEEKGITGYLDRFDGKIVKAPKTSIVEGGDIIIDERVIYVGVGRRTNEKGFEFIKKTFSDRYKVIRVKHKALHLDCALNILGKGHVLIQQNMLEHISKSINDRYKIINIPKEEYDMLTTNVLSLSKDTIIARDACSKTNKMLSKKGYEIIEIEFNEIPKTGGSVRCCSLPLTRI